MIAFTIFGVLMFWMFMYEIGRGLGAAYTGATEPAESSLRQMEEQLLAISSLLWAPAPKAQP